MRLLHLMNYQPLGTRAIDHFILKYARQARARNWEISFGFTADPPREFGDELRSLGVDWIIFQVPFTWSSARRIKKILANRRPDVLQTSFFSAFEKPLLGLKLGGFTKRLIVIDHSSGEGPSPNSKLAFLRKLRGKLVGRIIDAVVCVSQFNARRDVERVFLPASKVRIVPNGIDLGRFPFSMRDGKASLKVLYIGQLIREKGVLTLLEAMRQLGEPVELLIAGSGPQRSELESFVQRHAMANVRFLGHVADVAGLYSSVDIVAIPSEWAEAFGLVAIEAMACGAAVIASDAGALPEVVGDAGSDFRERKRRRSRRETESAIAGS